MNALSARVTEGVTINNTLSPPTCDAPAPLFLFLFLQTLPPPLLRPHRSGFCLHVRELLNQLQMEGREEEGGEWEGEEEGEGEMEMDLGLESGFDPRISIGPAGGGTRQAGGGGGVKRPPPSPSRDVKDDDVYCYCSVANRAQLHILRVRYNRNGERNAGQGRGNAL